MPIKSMQEFNLIYKDGIVTAMTYALTLIVCSLVIGDSSFISLLLHLTINSYCLSVYHVAESDSVRLMHWHA